MFRTTLGCSSRFTVLGSFLFFRNFIILNKEFSGFGSLFSFHCSFCCCPFFVISDNFYILSHPLSFVNNFFIFFKNFFWIVFRVLLRSLLGQHWKFPINSRFLWVSLSATNINISYLFLYVNIFFNFFYIFYVFVTNYLIFHFSIHNS